MLKTESHVEKNKEAEAGKKENQVANLGDPKATIEILKKYNFSFQKKFGQNFLIDRLVLDKIVRAAEITKEDVVLEVGPGIGTLTQCLCENARYCIAVEIDKNLIPILENDTLASYDNVEIVNDDILKTDLNVLLAKTGAKSFKVVANLPYYITTPVIMGLLEKNAPIDSMTVMVQKEVALRMQAGPGSKDYGALSLAIAYYAEPYLAANVPPNCFMPRPNVGSAVIRLKLHEEKPVNPKNESFMFKVIRASFNQRRKTLVNGLKNSQETQIPREKSEEALRAMGLDANIRGEQLTLEDFARLSDLLLEA